MAVINFDPNSEKIQATTQEHLDIYDVIDDLIIMKNGTVSLVLETSAVNFDLLSEPEQDAKIDAFSGLLNSLTFHIQILIRTQSIDIGNYVNYLQRKKDRELSPIVRNQLTIYMQFVKNLIRDRNVLEKRFFVVIPQKSGTVEKTNFIKQLFGKPVKITNIEPIVEKAKTNLYPKRDHIIRQLKRMGVEATQLKAEEAIKLFYNVYNPGTSPLQNLKVKTEDFLEPIVQGPKSIVNN